MVAKSEIPHPIYKLNGSPPRNKYHDTSQKKKQQQQQQNKTEIVAGLIWFLESYDDDGVFIVIDWY